MPELDEATMADIRAFIASVEWRFAKTMPWCPHYYNLLRWNPDRKDGFFKLEAQYSISDTKSLGQGHPRNQPGSLPILIWMDIGIG
jgi:hypothetical protein